MAPSPVAAPSQNNSSPSGNKNKESASLVATSPSTSQKKNSSPPPEKKSQAPPPTQKKSPSPSPPPPRPKASSPPPPATSPPPKQSSPSPPPPQQKEKEKASPSPSPSPSPPPPSQTKTTPEQKPNPPPPPQAEKKTPETPSKPRPETFSPPPPVTPGVPVAALAPPQIQGSNTLSPSSSGSAGSSGNVRSPADSNGLAPTRKIHSSSSSSSPSSENSTTIAIGVGVGVAMGILVIALGVFCILSNRKKKRKHYYTDPGFAPHPGSEYYNHGSTKWNSPPDHVVRLTPPPGMMATPGGPGGGGGWGHHPTPGYPTSKEFSAGTTPPPHLPLSPVGPNMALGFSKSQFTYEELASSTGGFSKANLLGQGGFGYVHKGVLPNGQVVAVKSLKVGSGQGEREFQAEVEIISRVHHRHLVSLVGYCIADGQRMLVYEYVPNQTMEFHLHGKNQPVMDWSTRLRIALGSAKGLAYLHEDCHPRIIHRDIKAANILLDNKFEAMVADFGLAKLSSDNYTHISTRVMGTFGYMAPEYASSGKLTEKSDVFSYGVMLLELITGRRPLDLSGNYMEEDSLVDWARPKLTKATEGGDFKDLVDPRLGDNYDHQEMARMVACAAASIRHSARRRPKMSQIARALEGDSSLDDLNDGGKSGANHVNTETYNTTTYNADMMRFRQMVMSSQDFTSSEYGHNPSSSSSECSGEMGGYSGYAVRK